jgi:hypothetical protein
MKLSPSNKTLAILFIVILAFCAVNTFLIVYQTATLEDHFSQNLNSLNQTVIENYNALNQSYIDLQTRLNGEIDNLNARLPVEQYDYVVYRNWNDNDNTSVYIAKNGKTGLADFNGTDAATVINQALTSGNNIYLKNDEYNLTSDIQLSNKKNARFDSDTAILNLEGHRILVKGTDYQESQNNQVSGLQIVNGTLRIENSFKTTVTNMIFENCKTAIEVTNTNTWSEATKLDTIHFNKCTQGITFRTNTLNGTGSYGNTLITRCYFNLLDNSTAITVEPNAELTDSQLINLRIWAGEFGTYNQTGLLVRGSMFRTLLDGVVFECFNPGQLLYAIALDTPHQTPVLQAGVTIIGSWTARINNPNSSWISGTGAVFKWQNINVPVGKLSYGQAMVNHTQPLTISSFKPRITVEGSFSHNETVTVRFRLNFIDDTVSGSLEKTLTASGTVWLSDDDLMQLYPSQDLIWSILMDAKVNSANSDAKVTVDVYGSTT